MNHNYLLMQLGLNSNSKFTHQFNIKYNEFCKLLISQIKTLARTSPNLVMLSDKTIRKQNSFDPEKIYNFFKIFESKLINFIVESTSTSITEDKRRIFLKFNTNKNNYILSANISFQYHVLLYYKPNNIVSKYQNELLTLSNNATHAKNNLNVKGNNIIISIFNKLGYQNLNELELFKIFFNNQSLVDEIQNKIRKEEEEHAKFVKQEKRILKKLDDLLVEIYSTKSILLDEKKLMEGEDGCSCSFYLKHKTKINVEKIPYIVQKEFLLRLDELINIMKNKI